MRELDASGLACPLPVLKLRKALATMEPGELIALITTDAMSVVDLPVFCAQAGHRILLEEKIVRQNNALRDNKTVDAFRFVIARGAES